MSSPEPVVHRYPSDDPRLGRHVFHDPTSRDYDLRALLLVEAAPTTVALWERHGPIFDQAACPPETLAELGADPARVSVGCCTMCTAYGLLLTEPYCTGGCAFTIADVLRGYQRVTQLDETAVPGVWPPEDTGSTGLFAMKVLRERGLIQAYRWAFRLNTALAYLAHGPIAVGSPWYDSMFTPVPRDGRMLLEITPDAAVVGGHEWVADGIDPPAKLVRMVNSWNAGWGEGGRAWLSYATFERLLGEQGDVVVPVARRRSALRGSMTRPSSIPDTPGVGWTG